jgi:DNA protecting protein DprA
MREEDAPAAPVRAAGSIVPRVRRETAIIALGEIPGVGHNTAVRLYDAANFDSLFTATRDEVHWLAGSAKVPSPHAFTDSFMKFRDAALEQANDELIRFEASGIELILDTDSRFPKSLLSLFDRPRWLFIRGSVELLSSERLITVVGTRQPTADGVRLAIRLTRILMNQGFAIVSGLAEGIDAVVHRETLDNKGQTVAVLGTGIFNDFPAMTAALRAPIIQNGGSIITEYFPKETYSRQRFVERNRIQAALSPITVPVEANVQSGTAHTIRFAKQYGREVLGVRWEAQLPTPLHEFLLSEGFKVIAIPESDDPLLAALGARYDYRRFAQESLADRRNARIGRAIKFNQQLIRSEKLTRLERERFVKAILETEGEIG